MMGKVAIPVSVWLFTVCSMARLAKSEPTITNQTLLPSDVAAFMERVIPKNGFFIIGTSFAVQERESAWVFIDGDWKTISVQHPQESNYVNLQFFCQIPSESMSSGNPCNLKWYQLRKWNWRYRDCEMPHYGQTGNEHMNGIDWLRQYHYRPPSGCVEIPDRATCLLAFIKPIDFATLFSNQTTTPLEKNSIPVDQQKPKTDSENTLTATQQPATGLLLECQDVFIPLELDRILQSYNFYCGSLKGRLPDVLPVDSETVDLCQRVFVDAVHVLSVVVTPLGKDCQVPNLHCCLTIVGSIPDGRWVCTSLLPEFRSVPSAIEARDKRGRAVSVRWRETNAYQFFD